MKHTDGLWHDFVQKSNESHVFSLKEILNSRSFFYTLKHSTFTKMGWGSKKMINLHFFSEVKDLFSKKRQICQNFKKGKKNYRQWISIQNLTITTTPKNNVDPFAWC